MSTDTAFADDGDTGSGLISSLPSILWERRWLILVPLVVCSIIGVGAAFLLPRSYVSSATLLVESQDLPGSTTTGGDDNVIDRRMARVRQQILSRPDLVQLIQDNDLYDVSDRKKPLSELVEQMRDDTSISAVDADIARSGAGGQNQGSIAFRLAFSYSQPELAQLVAQTFIDRLLKLDASQTQSSAQSNVRFLEDQEAALTAQVRQIEGEINRITGQNGAALANVGGLGTLNMGGAGNIETQIAALRRENAQLQTQLGRSAIDRDPNVIAAEGALTAAKATYADDHPDVKLAETRLQAARTTAAAVNAGAVSTSVQNQISVNNNMIGELTRAKAAEAGRAAVIAAAQARGPQVAQRVQQLQGRGDIIKADLSRVSSQLLQARGVEKLTDTQRGERLTLIEPPVTPDRPTSPNRPLLIAGGIFGGLALGVGLALLLELVLRPIRSVGTLTRITGVPPLGVVPVLKPRGTAKRRRNWLPFGGIFGRLFGRRRQPAQA